MTDDTYLVLKRSEVGHDMWLEIASVGAAYPSAALQEVIDDEHGTGEYLVIREGAFGLSRMKVTSRVEYDVAEEGVVA